MSEPNRPDDLAKLTGVPGALPGPADEPGEVGLDPTVAQLADPLLPALPAAELTAERLRGDLRRLMECSSALDRSRHPMPCTRSARASRSELRREMSAWPRRTATSSG